MIQKKIIFLHHSTGNCIWLGDTSNIIYKFTRKGTVQRFFDEYNKINGTQYNISELAFPKKQPYGWRNYPYDYYNIWVKNAGCEMFMEEPTLEILTSEYDVIIFKHCFPVGRIQEDTGIADINSEEKRIENYKLQYEALRGKMHSFPDTKFIIWTPPAIVQNKVSAGEAERAYKFYRWIMDEWNEEGDNIFIWDFYKYETEGSLYMNELYAFNNNDSHPNRSFSEKMALRFSMFVIDVIENRVEKEGLTEKSDGYQEFLSAHSAGDNTEVK